MRMQEQITQALQAGFSPLHLEVEDESHNHSVPEDNQSHFKVTLVSEQFQGKPLIARHRAVNAILNEREIMQRIHALALHTMTPDEWFAKGGLAPESPPCLGGGKS
jgi:BolA protein